MKKGLKHKIDMLLSLVIIAILLPLFITIICQRMQLEEIIYGEMQVSGESIAAGTEEGVQAGTELETEEGSAQGENDGDTETLQTEESPLGAMQTGNGEGGQTDGKQKTMDPAQAEERVLGIVAKEIGANANRDAILAQCVIARTNLYDAMEKHTEEPETLEIEEMRNLWGDNFQEIYQELRECVALTEGQVLLWNGDYIYAAYHAMSAGRTRDMTEMYADAKMPYLIEKSCQEDVTAKGFLTVGYYEEHEFLEMCRGLSGEVPAEKNSGQEADGAEIAVEKVSDVEILDRDDTGYVNEIKVGDATFSGEEFRKQLNLNSSCFTITEMEGKVRIVTKGLGHGFGLSQNAANHMAEEGKGYEEILAYFYPGTELKTLSPQK